MSRITDRAYRRLARPSTGAVNRPSAGQVNDFLDVSRPATGRVFAGARQAIFSNPAIGPAQLPAGTQVANRPSRIAVEPWRMRITSRPGVGGAGVGVGIGAGIGAGVADNVGARAGDRRQNMADDRPSRIENRQQLQDNRQQRRDEIRDQVRDNHPRLDFWANNPNWARWRINAPYRWAAWGALTGWFGWGTGYTETTYAYGDNVYYSEDQVYYGDAPVATAEEYADQAAAIAASAPQNLDPSSSEWLPLGVFAATQDREATGPDPTLFLQLAVNKDGVISGTFSNMATGDNQTIEGMVDKKSQRVAWCVEGKSWPIVETGLASLTTDTFPVLVHFEDGQTQQWLLVRLEEPKT